MKTHTQVRLVVIGSADRQLEEWLQQSGAVVSTLSLDMLVSLAQSGSAAHDALVVDLREQRAVPEALAHVKRNHPQLGVVIVAAQLDPALMLEAMRAGVTEWIAAPVTATTVVDAVHRVVTQRAKKAEPGQVFAFVGAKGGVGTTTVATNVVTALGAAPPRKTLLIDLHLVRGDAALFLGAEPRFSTADVLENIHRLDEAFLKGLVTSTKFGVDLLAAAEGPLRAAVEPRHVRELIAFAAQCYPCVVLDVPHADMAMLDSLEMTAAIVVVANQEVATVRRAGGLALALRQRYGNDRVGVIINRFDPNAEIRREDVERVTGAVRLLIPSDYRVALEGLNQGQPVVALNRSQLAAAFTTLARTLAGAQTGTLEKPERQTGLFGRLRLARA